MQCGTRQLADVENRVEGEQEWGPRNDQVDKKDLGNEAEAQLQGEVGSLRLDWSCLSVGPNIIKVCSVTLSLAPPYHLHYIFLNFEPMFYWIFIYFLILQIKIIKKKKGVWYTKDNLR